ncbi:hypothetical protein BLJ79_15270 [Arthrobacter sp. UCD-GKA]|uniref:hypothetical protein n=1 Tax=Arthrobacter sp. UCD-GKA TaxID=1913576 RepID=UPI0008DD0941|nr:hypothetical protein [Arthrobacter sp. UCD-GKA]OIH83438.1 hypothetical protein BLJ79_15270 [Arthrobacter sp. UCD-GKA]
MKTVPAGAGVRRGRLAKAVQFRKVATDALELADEAKDVADAVVTLCVHAGIAAADAICAFSLGEHAKGDDHREAVKLLATVDGEAAQHLGRLLKMKTKAGYGHDPVSGDNLKQAQRCMNLLLDAAIGQI